jgi:SAM-dependent methyltransferase
MFGILSDPAKYGGGWDVDEFLASGRDHIHSLFRSLGHHAISFSRHSCLDFGCGVGRLTVPLSETFNRVVGVDVASSMIEGARRYHAANPRCEFLVNADEDLRQFRDSTFDFVHSSLVLQHIPPAVALGYVSEFFRVCRPLGLVVFQLPSGIRPRRQVEPLPHAAFAAEITVVVRPTELALSETTRLRVEVINKGPAVWPHDIPDGRQISLGNHWLDKDGHVVIRDDGRSPLPRTIEGGDWFEAYLDVRSPSEPGEYEIEVDLVQESVCWFADMGSATARIPVTVSARAAQPSRPTIKSVAAPSAEQRREATPLSASGLMTRFDRIRRRLRLGRNPFEMHAIPRPIVEAVIRSAGGQLLRAVDDNAAGPQWSSFTYICRRQT